MKDATLIADYHARMGNHELFVMPVMMFSNVIGKSFNPKLLVENVLVSSIQSKEYGIPNFYVMNRPSTKKLKRRKIHLKLESEETKCLQIYYIPRGLAESPALSKIPIQK